MPGTVSSTDLILSAEAVSTLRSPPNTLMEFSLVLQILREVEFDPRELILQDLLDLVRQDILIDPWAPLVGGLQRRKQFYVEKARRIGAVVGSALLGHNGFHLREGLYQLTHAVCVAVPLLQRDSGGQRSAYPQITFLKLGHELDAERSTDKPGGPEQHERADEHEEPVGDREP